jgi:hypothetical protein
MLAKCVRLWFHRVGDNEFWPIVEMGQQETKTAARLLVADVGFDQLRTSARHLLCQRKKVPVTVQLFDLYGNDAHGSGCTPWPTVPRDRRR